MDFISTTAETNDGGVYICTAANKYGMIIHGTFLRVKSVGEETSSLEMGILGYIHSRSDRYRNATIVCQKNVK